MIFMYKCIKVDLFPEFKSRLINCIRTHNYDTRDKGSLKPPVFRLEMCKHSYFYKGITLWNDLDQNIKNSLTIDVFKKSVKMLLLQNINI